MSKLFSLLTHTNFHNMGARVRMIAMILVLVISLLGMNQGAASAAGNTYYVNNTAACSESGPGSMAQPFCTITKGTSVAVAGDTVRVIAGTYAETVFVSKSGTAGNPITFQANPGVTVTGDSAGFGSAFAVSSQSYIVIDGFTIANTKYKGIYVDSSNHITISDNDVSYAGANTGPDTHQQGIFVRNTTDSLITENVTHHNSCIGIRLINGSNNNIVSDNVSYANSSAIADPNVVISDAAGIEVTGSNNNTIINNITYGNEDSGINIYVNSATPPVGSSYNLVIGNLSYGNGDHGIDHNNSPYNTVIGNTVHGNGTTGINFEGNVGTGSHHATVINNISVGNGLTPPTGSFGGNLRVDSASVSGTVLDYNLLNRESASVQIIWNNTNYGGIAAFRVAEPTQEVHGLEGNPLFVAPVASVLRTSGVAYPGSTTTGDYHLSGGSPAIDSANSNAPSQPSSDIEGYPRVDDLATANTGAGTRAYDDRGAYEFQPSGSNMLPTVTTQAVTSIAQTTATGNGNITSLGVPNPTQHGVVWSLSANPTTLDSKTTNGPASATGAFTANMTGLTPGTLYHVRAYATNAAGTAYGADVTFTTLAATGNTGSLAANQTVASSGVTNANNGWTSNNQYATFDSSSDTADYGFPDLGIPAGSTIDGIEVTIEGQRNGMGASRNLTAALWNTSALNPDAYTASKTATLSSDDTTQTLGGQTDKWGTTWTTADFADATFKIRVGATFAGGEAALDAVTVKVYYTLPPSKVTNTTVNCGAGTPTVAYGTDISCVATVVRTAGSNTPTGNVSWTTNGGGTFATSPCTLSGSGGTATCSVTYTPNAVGTGSHLISAAYPGDANFEASTGSQTVTVTPKSLTITGVTATEKIYDGTNAATLAGTPALVGVVTGDTVTLGGTPVATFANKNVGTAKPVTVTGYTISGASAGSYTITQPTGLTANITAASLTVTGVTANNKVYNANTTATVNTGSAALVGVIAGDTVNLNKVGATGAFADKNVGAGKIVTVSGLALTGADAGNYLLTQPTATADITAKDLTVGADGINKVYDGTTTATVTLSTNALAGDTVTAAYVSAAFADKNVDTGKSVTVTGISISGVDAANYQLGNTTANTTANITSLPITVTAQAKTKFVGMADPMLTYSSVPALFSGDAFTGKLTRDAGEAEGQYAIKKGTLSAGSNYTITFVEAYLTIVPMSPSSLDVYIGTELQQHYDVDPNESTRDSYLGVNAGPVKLISTNGVPIMAAERLIYKVNGVATSFSEMMALPNNQLDKVYWLPWYNNNGKDLDTQLRFGNVNETGQATVQVFIGNTEMTTCTSIPAMPYPYVLDPGESVRVSCPNTNNGPVKIVSDVNIVAAERLIYKANGVATSFTEMMALPNNQLDKVYWLPWYNNNGKDLDTQLRFGNVSEAETATVHVFIGDAEISGCTAIPAMPYPYVLDPGESVRVSCPNTNNGPVEIVSDVNIVAAERLIYTVNGVATSFSEMMAMPSSQLDKVYWLPWYNNGKDLDTQLRFGNVSETEQATVQIYIGDTEMTTCTSTPAMPYPYVLDPGESVRVSCPNTNNGPVKIVSDIPIVAAERMIYKVSGVATSFTEMMAMPGSLLDSIDWFPWYNNNGNDLDTQLRFGVPK